MSQILEIPDNVYHELRQAAEASGLTPVDWIAAHLPVTNDAESRKNVNGSSTATLAERFAGRVGRIASGGKESMSENGGEAFADYLESKRKAGHL